MHLWCLVLFAAIITGCQSASRESVFTDLRGGACSEEIDKSDPNNTPFLLCPGAGGYRLRVRQVESGRQSVDVVSPTGQVLPLSIQNKVTRAMNSLGPQAEWRLLRGLPLALILKVEVREDVFDPEKITRALYAVAKLQPAEACITATAPQQLQGQQAADLAAGMPCQNDLNP
jgi:hypothetical protein